MTSQNMLAMAAASTILFGVIGGVAGYSIGTWAPAYYYVVFEGSDDASFDQVGAGIGLGVTQGLIGGAIVGLVLIVASCWQEGAMARPSEEQEKPAAVHPRHISPRGPLQVVLAALFGLFVLAFICGGSILLGAVLAGQRAYHRQYLDEWQIVAPVLEDEEFARVEIMERSNGGIHIHGEDLARLHQLVRDAIGGAFLEERVYVQVAEDAD